MISMFDDVTNEANTGRKSAVRALQAWQYLIGKAANRQIVKYDELRLLMGYPTNNPLASILGCIMFFCKQNNLPSLTIIVVNRDGVPGEGFTAEEIEDYHKKWYISENLYKLAMEKIEEFENLEDRKQKEIKKQLWENKKAIQDL